MIENETHSHAHHTGIPWLDVILAGSAIFISLVSLIISIHHGRTMEQLVAANEKQVEASTLPILRLGSGNMSSESGRDVKMIHFDLTNGGTGPAIIEWLRIDWDGRPTVGPLDLLNRCCTGTPLKSLSAWRNIASGTTLPARESQTVFSIRPESATAEVYQRLNDEARFKAEAEACYCSVLDECWVTDFKGRPRKVKSCEDVPAEQRW